MVNCNLHTTRVEWMTNSAKKIAKNTHECANCCIGFSLLKSTAMDKKGMDKRKKCQKLLVVYFWPFQVAKRQWVWAQSCTDEGWRSRRGKCRARSNIVLTNAIYSAVSCCCFYVEEEPKGTSVLQIVYFRLKPYRGLPTYVSLAHHKSRRSRGHSL